MEKAVADGTLDLNNEKEKLALRKSVPQVQCQILLISFFKELLL